MHPLASRALLDVGKREGDPAIPWATAARPWCARAASEWLRDCGVAVPVTWGALALLRRLAPWSIDHRTATVGDVVGWRRSGPDQGHVEVVVEDRGDTLVCVGGNVRDAVRLSVRPRGKVRFAARPVGA